MVHVRRRPAETLPVILTVHADAGRPAIRVPVVVLAVTCLCSIAVFVVGVVEPGSAYWHNASQASLRVAPICCAVACYLRFVYVPRTVLVVDGSCVTVTQPWSRRRVDWRDIQDVAAAGWLTPTHRGGIGAGVRLRLKAGGTSTIPDVFELDRRQLADKLNSIRPRTGKTF